MLRERRHARIQWVQSGIAMKGYNARAGPLADPPLAPRSTAEDGEQMPDFFIYLRGCGNRWAICSRKQSR